MKHIIKITTSKGSVEVLAKVNQTQNIDFVEFDINEYRKVEDLAIKSGFDFPDLLPDSVLYAINEGGVSKDSWEADEGEDNGFSFEIIGDTEDKYEAYKHNGRWEVEYIDETLGNIWQEVYKTKKEIQQVYSFAISRKLLTFIK